MWRFQTKIWHSYIVIFISYTKNTHHDHNTRIRSKWSKAWVTGNDSHKLVWCITTIINIMKVYVWRPVPLNLEIFFAFVSLPRSNHILCPWGWYRKASFGKQFLSVFHVIISFADMLFYLPTYCPCLICCGCQLLWWSNTDRTKCDLQNLICGTSSFRTSFLFIVQISVP